MSNGTAKKLRTRTPAGVKLPAPSGLTRERLLFDALQPDAEDTIAATSLLQALTQSGIRLNDPRVLPSVQLLRDDGCPGADRLNYQQFLHVVKPSILLVDRAVRREFVLPDFQRFDARIHELFEEVRENRAGAVANYIPQLGRVDPEKYGLALCTIDGQRSAHGDATTPFCVQSVCKPIGYCLTLEEHGEQRVHEHMGCEPSGRSFNDLALNPEGRPHNPMINAGGIMSSALIKRDLTMADRFDYVLDMWARLSGGTRPGFSNPTYLSELRTADRNFALGYFMREKAAFPPDTDVIEALEFYFQQCSLEVTADSIAVVAATLANGGVCPITGQRVFRPDTVQKCLSLMGSCGMYDFSGEWAFRVGLPAKSGVSGIIVVVVPNVLGLAIWSPRLDAHGNSVRGIDFCQRLVNAFNFHAYDNLVGELHAKDDPRGRPEQSRRNLLVDLYWAASEGDLNGIRRLVVRGIDLNEADYDGRTALHLAASEGQTEVVEYFIARQINLTPIDRWGHTPLDDAERGGHAAVVRLLRTRLAA